jgi:hypothetical protein
MVSSVSTTAPCRGATGAGCLRGSTVISNALRATGANAPPAPGCDATSSKRAGPSSALVGVHVTVWVSASNTALAGRVATSTRVSSRSWSMAATPNEIV